MSGKELQPTHPLLFNNNKLDEKPEPIPTKPIPGRLLDSPDRSWHFPCPGRSKSGKPDTCRAHFQPGQDCPSCKLKSNNNWVCQICSAYYGSDIKACWTNEPQKWKCPGVCPPEFGTFEGKELEKWQDTVSKLMGTTETPGIPWEVDYPYGEDSEG